MTLVGWCLFGHDMACIIVFLFVVNAFFILVILNDSFKS